MNTIYQQVNISKQAFHQWLNRRYERVEEQEQLLQILPQIRENHPRMSCRHFYDKLQPRTMGRDQFESFCHANGYKVDIRRRKYRTTDSTGVQRFPNLLLNIDELTGINQLWVSDITYYEIKEDVYYLTFVMDVYNREIVGYSVSDNLRTESTTQNALKQAIRKRRLLKESGLIFHSDGGGQYYCKDFTSLTKAYGIKNSMGKTAYENPLAERVNGIIKNDYLYPWNPGSIQELSKMLIRAIHLYNTDRPHASLMKHSPQEFLNRIERGLLTKIWVVNKKKKVTKKEKVNINIY
jgi:putative transposase